jgi:translation initiation factor IF-2
MANVTLLQLAKKVGMTEEQLRARSSMLGFDIDASAKSIDKDLAQMLEEEFLKELKDTAETYDELVSEQIQKEIVKKQRKQTAGKTATAKTTAKSVATAVAAPQKAKETIELPDVISVKEFAEKLAVSPVVIIGELMKNGILANINQQIDYETAHIIAGDLHFKTIRRHMVGESEDILKGDLERILHEDDDSVLQPRPPVVTVMGHVDHGKTQLLDTIRHANVVASEAGGITQHIGAYQVTHNGQKITFLDTPGHEAFTAMRARGARVTDIAILVVAADEGVKPQTLEALAHAKEAEVPLIVAINKMDKPHANPDKVKSELSEHGVISEQWGGDTPMVPVSALKKQGIEDLLQTILVVAEMQNLKANPNRPAVGTVIEAHLDPNLGPVATILINTGTLRVMDPVVVGGTSGRIKLMQDAQNKRLKALAPSDVAQIAGLEKTPQAGDILQVVSSERAARVKAEEISSLIQEGKIQNMGMGLNEIVEQIKVGQLKTVKVVLKADTKGSLEAIKERIAKELKSADVAVKVIHSGVGNVTESDVMMAAASRGMVIGFHTDVPAQVSRMAERMRTEVAVYKIIYELLNDLKKLLAGLLEPEIITTELGSGQVLKIFFTGKDEMVVGCAIKQGKVEKKCKARIHRGDAVISEADVTGLKIVNEDVNEVEKGNECGLRLKSKIRLMEKDKLEFYKKETRHRTL